MDLQGGRGFGGSAEGDTLFSIENLFGSEHNDTLIGSVRGNELHGQGGNDILKGGGGGADRLYGENGNDHLEGGSGPDVLDGGPGSDTASYLGSPSGVTVLLYNGNKWGGDAEGDTLVSIENLIGSQHNDSLRGDDNANVLLGDLGNDVLLGYGGADVLMGGDGFNSLKGHDGDDTLHGEDGQDTILGGMGRDVLHGGDSPDTFIWRSTDETGVTAATADVILDFTESDYISVSLIDANVIAAGNQAFTFIGNAAFSGTPGEINYVHVRRRHHHPDADRHVGGRRGRDPSLGHRHAGGELVRAVGGLHDHDKSGGRAFSPAGIRTLAVVRRLDRRAVEQDTATRS